MERMKRSTAAKVLACILLIGCLLVGMASVVVIGMANEAGLYEQTVESFWKERVYDQMAGDAREMVIEYSRLEDLKSRDSVLYEKGMEEFQLRFAAENCGLKIIIRDSADRTLWMNGAYSAEYTKVLHVRDLERTEYQVELGIRTEMKVMNPYGQLNAFRWVMENFRYSAFPIGAGAVIAFALLLIFLIRAAGWHKGQETVVPNGLDRIPLDLYAAILTALFWIGFRFCDETVPYWLDWVAVLLLVFWGTILGVALILSVATRVKMGKWWQNTLFYRAQNVIWKGMKKLWRGICELISRFPTVWKFVFGLVVLIAADVFAVVSGAVVDAPQTTLILMAIKYILLTPVVLITAFNLRDLEKQGQDIAAGKVTGAAKGKYLSGDFLKFSETLDDIEVGINHAVEERIRSERMRTELITNVSHDLKTPLTSLVSYIDLLKKEEITQEPAAGYIEVLDRQSAKLKKLTEDLVELSKAATGNITVHPETVNLNILLPQVLGEYTERMLLRNLELISRIPEEEITVWADGNLLWRVMDNLMSNICKYAMGGTRVYVSLEKEEEQTRIVFRNISENELNVSAEELMERFVRGDASRNSEGSGLGLSIAKSLTELQGGNFDLAVDGDLFKVTLGFAEPKQPVPLREMVQPEEIPEEAEESNE